MKPTFNPFTGKLDMVLDKLTFFDVHSIWQLGNMTDFLDDQGIYNMIDGGTLDNISNCTIFKVGNIGDI